MTTNPMQAAEHFLEKEKAFHLGEMLTEQSHPTTRRLSQVLAGNTVEGLTLLLHVDDDLLPVAKRTIVSEAFFKLRNDMEETLRSGNRIFFSGCGATGRLAILLDAAHRRFCRRCARLDPESRTFFETLAEQTLAVMTGGDFALIRSVESFEDYTAFGKRQMIDAGIRPDDCLVAVSEGGETSSVIGTIHAALETGAKTHFLFNNPSELLVRKVERSRIVLEDPRVNGVDLATGPMAVAGSTRMQATTIELLIAGLALEGALFAFLQQALAGDSLRRIVCTPSTAEEGVRRFERLLEQLRRSDNLDVLAVLTDFEHSIYAASGLTTYFPDEYSLDIFTDTTERSPTFKTPPFRSTLETGAPEPWAYVKDPMRPTEEAWRSLLGREPRCIEWTSKDYEALGADARIVASPPRIDASVLKTYRIGKEPEPQRYAVSPNAAIAFLVGEEAGHWGGNDAWAQAFLEASNDFERRAGILVGPNRPAGHWEGALYAVDVALPSSPLDLIAHLAMKLVLNNVSTATMGKLGRLSGNWMAHVDATNKKLIDRSIRLVAELADVDYRTACFALFESMYEMESWSLARRKTISPAAYTVERLRKKTVEY